MLAIHSLHSLHSFVRSFFRSFCSLFNQSINQCTFIRLVYTFFQPFYNPFKRLKNRKSENAAIDENLIKRLIKILPDLDIFCRKSLTFRQLVTLSPKLPNKKPPNH